MKLFPIAAIVLLSIYGCAGKEKKVAQPGNNTEAIDSFFPVTSFIKGQLLLLDSLQVTPLQIITKPGKTDSIWLTKEKLKPYLLPFATPTITETNFIPYFKQTRFKDLTINAITFTYDPLAPMPDSINLRHWDIYINPETGNVSKVYIVKEIKEKGVDLTLQLTWQSNKWAKITTLVNKPNGKMELVKDEKFVWDF